MTFSLHPTPDSLRVSRSAYQVGSCQFTNLVPSLTPGFISSGKVSIESLTIVEEYSFDKSFSLFSASTV